MSSSLYSTMAETPESSFAREVMNMQSQVGSFGVPGEQQLQQLQVKVPAIKMFVVSPSSQIKYKDEGLKSLPHSLYSQLPHTTDTQFAKSVSELQSEVGGANVCIQLDPANPGGRRRNTNVNVSCSFRGNTRKQGKRRPPARCTPHCRRPWTPDTPERRLSCKARSEATGSLKRRCDGIKAAAAVGGK